MGNPAQHSIQPFMGEDESTALTLKARLKATRCPSPCASTSAPAAGYPQAAADVYYRSQCHTETQRAYPHISVVRREQKDLPSHSMITPRGAPLPLPPLAAPPAAAAATGCRRRWYLTARHPCALAGRTGAPTTAVRGATTANIEEERGGRGTLCCGPGSDRSLLDSSTWR